MNKTKKALLLALSLALSATLFAGCDFGSVSESSTDSSANSGNTSVSAPEESSPIESVEPECTHENKEEKSDETNHWLECECGETFEVEVHVAGTEVKYDETNHWNECECGYEMNVTAHTIVGGNNETHHWGECDCGYVAEETVHTYNIAKSDETHHWNECVCGASEEKAAHDYVTENHDATNHWLECACGAKSTAEAHVAGAEVKFDESNHWNECECGYEMNVAEHVAGAEVKFDENNHWNECECGYEMSVVEHTYNIEKFDETHHWNECECGAGEEKVAHDYVLDDTDAAVDKLNCECGAEGASFNKIVTAARQTITLDAENNSLSLEGIDAYESVALILFNDYKFGTDINALAIPEELKADTASHGEQELIVFVVDADGYEHTISVPVTIVTKTIKTADDLKALQIQAATETVYGHYVLGGDITSNSAITANAGWTEGEGQTNDGTQGFCGVLDGNNYTITTPAGVYGLFGTIGKSVIKNVTFTCTSIDSTQWATTFLARLAVGATFENVTINLNNITNGPKGAIVELATRDCDFINVTININGAVQNLFGAHTGGSLTMGMNAAQADYPDTLCTFTNCAINLKKEDSTLGMLGQCYNGTAYNTYIVNGCDTTEGITVEGITLTSPRPDVKLANQDVLTTAETVSLDLGEYAAYTVKSISLNGEDIGTTDVSAVTIPASIKENPAMHGTGSAYTIVVDKDGADYKVAIPVTFITAEIASEADFAMVQLKSNGASVYGYYVLTADIGTTAPIASVGNDCYTADANGNAGFRGTLDGKGHTITYSVPESASGGLFGAIGSGAVIKNVTFDVPTVKAGYHMALFGGSVVGATFDNVDFKFQKITNTDYEANAGLLAGFSLTNCTFKDVDFYLNDSTHWNHNIGVLFAADNNADNSNNGFNAACVAPCTFESCNIYLATGVELGRLGSTTSAGATQITYVADGCSLNGAATEGTKVEGITIVKATA